MLLKSQIWEKDFNLSHEVCYKATSVIHELTEMHLIVS